MTKANEPYVVPDKYKPKPFVPKKGEFARDMRYLVLSFLGLVAVLVAKYFLDFRLLPMLFPALYPVSVGAIFIWLALTIVISFLALKFVSGFSIFYEIADAIYALMVLVWPLGLYGLGTVVPVIAGALIAWVIMYGIQRVMLWGFILVGFIKM